MNSTKPIIGITSSVLDIEIKGEVNPCVQVNHQYVKAVLEIGCTPIVIPVGNDDMAKHILELCDGVLFSSGEDVHPSFYDESPTEDLKQLNIARDEMEISLAKLAVDKNLPIIGTCRGLGIINVALGGTMKQDIEKTNKDIAHNQKTSRKLATHDISIKKDSHLYGLLGEETAVVNSKHHQAIDKLAPSLKVAATAHDDVIEAVEAKDPDQFILGLQFHPEELFADDTGMLNLLMGFKKACQK
jgi:putative glutamine amidotransferase